MTSHKPSPPTPTSGRSEIKSSPSLTPMRRTLSVAEARHAVAREFGFDDWDALRTEIEPASTYTARAEAHKATLSPDLPEETSLEVVKVLIDAGADINAGRQWRTHLGEVRHQGTPRSRRPAHPARRGR